jgi:hypothetical protein
MSKELYWYDNYFMDYNLKNMNNYIHKLSSTSNKNENTIVYKVNQIENEYEDKINEITELCNNQLEIEKIKKKSSLVILQKELEIIKLLTKYTLQNKKLKYNFFISCLEILLNLSEILRIKLGQKELINNKQKNDDNITRCSYKFCSYKDNCSYNYNFKIKNLCYQDHYVHNMVSADLKNLLEYIKKKYDNVEDKNILHNKEILKTINTLSFVISHMESELKSKCFYLQESEWDTYHVVKNI